MKFRLLVHAEKQLLADAERDKCYAEPKTSKVAIPPDKPCRAPAKRSSYPPHSPAPMRALGGCGARGAEANS